MALPSLHLRRNGASRILMTMGTPAHSTRVSMTRGLLRMTLVIIAAAGLTATTAACNSPASPSVSVVAAQPVAPAKAP